MSKCPGCERPVSPAEAECSYCGTPLRPGGEVKARPVVAGRKTYIDAPKGSALGEHSSPSASASESESLYVPRARRPAAPEKAPGSEAQDPFAAAATGAPSTAEEALLPRKATKIEASTHQGAPTEIGHSPGLGVGDSGSRPADPWAEAIAEGPSGDSAPQTDRTAPVAGMIVGALLNFSLEERGTLHAVRLGRTVIGRKGDADLHVEVDDGKVSSPHCVLVARSSGVFLQDHMSTNGTFFRRGEEGDFADLQVEMNNSAMLEHGDFVRVGDTILQYLSFDRAQIQRIWG